MEMNRSASCWRAIRTRSSSVRNMSRSRVVKIWVAVQILECCPQLEREGQRDHLLGGALVCRPRRCRCPPWPGSRHDDERTRLGVALKRTQAVCLGSGLGGGGRGDLLGKRLFRIDDRMPPRCRRRAETSESAFSTTSI